MKQKTTKTGSASSAAKADLRPPVVVILGHIDHGKTTLLSKIKEIDLTRKEHGGITQHIGAYQVEVRDTKNEIHDTQKEKHLTSHISRITFIDTPGHAAFNKMRSRGAKVADLAVLVVAANEGIKPQTLESLKFIEQAKINYLVALNKIDLPGFDLEKAKKNLSDNGIPVEGFGGDIVVVPISAKEGKGIEDLLEMILLLAEMAGFKGTSEEKLEAIVIESKLDSHKGPLATILIRHGSLKIGDEVKVENSLGKIKAMFDERGQNVEKALPSQPVEVLGFKTVPPVGGQVVITEGTEKDKGQKKIVSSPVKEVSETESKAPEDTEEKKLRVILKADMEGTLEAIKNSLPADCQIMKAEVGDVNDSDVLLADTNKAEIIAFNVKVTNTIKKLAEVEEVKISSYQVIYELLEDIDRKILKIMEPTIDEQVLGKAEILAEFPGKQKIAGCRMMEGEIKKSDQLHLLRKTQIIATLRIRSMKKGKQDVQLVKKGDEFGVVLTPAIDFLVGDVLVSFHKPQVGP